jgi:hypothetical protein
MDLYAKVLSPTTLLQWIQNFTLLLNLISVQESITHYNIKLYPPGQTIINTVSLPVYWNIYLLCQSRIVFLHIE